MKSPYVVGLMAGGSGPSREQQDWMLARIKMLVTGLHRMAGSEARLVVRQVMMPGPYWDWTSKMRCPHMTTFERGIDWKPHSEQRVLGYFRQMDVDEVWLLNSRGRGTLSNSPMSRVYLMTMGRLDHHKFKLIPSWQGPDLQSSTPTKRPTEERKLQWLLNLN